MKNFRLKSTQFVKSAREENMKTLKRKFKIAKIGKLLNSQPTPVISTEAV